MAVNKTEMLEEKKESTRADILAKIARLDGYIKKTEMRVKKHERALVKLRSDMKIELKKAMKGILKGKIYG